LGGDLERRKVVEKRCNRIFGRVLEGF